MGLSTGSHGGALHIIRHRTVRTPHGSTDGCTEVPREEEIHRFPLDAFLDLRRHHMRRLIQLPWDFPWACHSPWERPWIPFASNGKTERTPLGLAVRSHGSAQGPFHREGQGARPMGCPMRTRMGTSMQPEARRPPWVIPLWEVSLGLLKAPWSIILHISLEIGNVKSHPYTATQCPTYNIMAM